MEALTPGLVAEIACAAPNFHSVEVPILSLLEHHIGADTAFFIDKDGPTASIRGVVAEFGTELARAWPRLAKSPGARNLVSAAQAGNGVVVDSELFGSTLRQQYYYQLVMEPVHGVATMFTVLPHRGRLKTELVLGRCSGSPEFSNADKALVASLVPTLSLAVLAHHQKKADATRTTPSPRLTAREREVLGYLRLGYTNQQIGMALGTRERTVRNQLSSIYEKLGVATRAEAVGTLVHGR
jgi:DNA-binding CsgD family transcriptional regulator